MKIQLSTIFITILATFFFSVSKDSISEKITQDLLIFHTRTSISKHQDHKTVLTASLAPINYKDKKRSWHTHNTAHQPLQELIRKSKEFLHNKS